MTTCTMQNYNIDINDSWDVIVVGGGPAGCAAASAAARENSKTLLIEAASALGGMGTLGLVTWFEGYDDRKKIIARGIAEKVLIACKENTPHLKKGLALHPFAAPSIYPELLKRVYDDIVTKAGADILFQSQVCAVEKSNNNKIDSILVANKKGLTAYKANIYIDCTGDGDIAAWAGASYEKGDSNNNLQPATHCFMINNIDEYALANGPQVHFYDPDSPIHKAIKSDKYPDIQNLHSCCKQIGPGTYGFNTGHIYNVDNTDPENISKALIQGRKMAGQYRDAFAEYLPAFANSFLTATGTLMGSRETRRVIGDYYLTIEDYMAKRSFPDEICRNAYELDIHVSEEEEIKLYSKPLEEIRKKIDSMTKNYSPGESYGVPYRCLTPKGLDNLLIAGRCISSDRLINGSLRIMACCLTTGEAAGIAAAMSALSSENVRKVDTNTLRGKLKSYGAYLPKV